MNFSFEKKNIEGSIDLLITKFKEVESKLIISNQELNTKIHSLTKSNEDLEIKYRLRVNENNELKEDAKNLNKVSLLKNIHKQYDKLQNKYNIMEKRLEYYKNKAGSNISVTNLVVDKLEENSEDADEDEVGVELIKIKRKRYFIEDTVEDIRNVYAALKDGSEYDVGDLIGTYDGQKITFTS